jgi:hypothetical protein
MMKLLKKKTAGRLGITVEKAAAERKAYVYMFGDDTQFAKMSLVHTNLKAPGSSVDITETLTRAGLPEGAQYNSYARINTQERVRKEGWPTDSVYVMCLQTHATEIQNFMQEFKLHEVRVDTEPELTQMVSAWTRMHAQVAMVLEHHQGLGKLIRDGNEQVEMLEHTEILGKYVEDEVERLRVNHVHKRQKGDTEMSEVEGGEQSTEAVQGGDAERGSANMTLNENQRLRLIASAKEKIDSVYTNAIEGGSAIQQHFETADASHTTLPKDDDLDTALNMHKEDMLIVTKTERVRIMMLEVLDAMTEGETILTWKDALEKMNYPTDMSDIQIPSAIRALVAEDLREIYEFMEVGVPTVTEQIHKLPGNVEVRVVDGGTDMEDELQQYEWPNSVAQMFRQLEHDATALLQKTHSELVRINPGEYNYHVQHFK